MRATHDIAACIYDESVGCQQGFDLFNQQKPFVTLCNPARCRGLQNDECAFNLGLQRRDACLTCGAFSSSERGTRRLGTKTSHCDPRQGKLMYGSQRRWKGSGIEPAEPLLRLVEAAYEKKPPDFKVTRMRRIPSVAMLFESDTS
jgi:hypothetical protein